jgi:hypothetical protein
MMGQKGISMNKIILVLGLTLLSCVTIPYIEGVKGHYQRHPSTRNPRVAELRSRDRCLGKSRFPHRPGTNPDLCLFQS